MLAGVFSHGEGMTFLRGLFLELENLLLEVGLGGGHCADGFGKFAYEVGQLIDFGGILVVEGLRIFYILAMLVFNLADVFTMS